MYYEAYQKKTKQQRRRRRRGPGEWLALGLARLLAILLALALLCAALLYALPPSLFMVEPDENTLSLTDGLPGSRINVLLLGTDVLKDNAQRSDAMMIASIGYGSLKLTTVMRDILVDIPEHGRKKLNAAYAYGGPELVMRTLNETFGLNLMHYAQVDFVSLVELVDAIGGVEVSITEAERDLLNDTVRDSGRVFAPLGYTAHELLEYGEHVHLDGLQALAYARIRKLDSDYMRTSRQRALLKTMVAKVRANLWNPVLLTRLVRCALNAVNTNMSPLQLVSLGEKVLLSGEVDQLRLPVDGTFTDNGSSLELQNRNANRSAFMRFAYESEP